MTSITSVSTTGSTAALLAGTSATSSPARHRTGRGQDPLDSVTALLGTSRDDLKAQLAAGKSLSDVAQAQGVSHDDLIAALAAGRPADAPAGVTSTGAASTDVEEAMAAQVGGPRPPLPPAGRHPGGSTTSTSGVVTGSLTAGQTSAASSLSDLLGTGSDDLLAELQGGSDLLEMLQSKGITRSQASATVGEGFLLDATA